MNLVVGVYDPDLGVRWLNWERVEWDPSRPHLVEIEQAKD